MKKKIAWGASKLLKMYLFKNKSNPFSYCIDDFSKESDIYGMAVRKSDSLTREKPGSFLIVIFAVTNKALKEISLKLNSFGLLYGVDYIFYSDFFYKKFLNRAQKCLGFKLDPRVYRFALSSTLNSSTAIHTTVLGTWLFLELLNRLDNISGHIAEVGAYEGGNALCGLNFMTRLAPKKYYIFDSFEGFPVLSRHDPRKFQSGDYKIQTSFHEILDRFSVFPEAIIVKGFVPASFSKIPKGEKFSLVFYDCDLYQPALDTFEFFWDKIVPGGYLLVHDYETEEGGFVGVKKATEEFFGRKTKFCAFFENTMAVIKKQKK